MKKSVQIGAIASVVLAAAIAFPVPAPAAVTVTAGMPINVFADPSDFVAELDTAGACGSKYFHIQRANANFKEMTAVALTAFSTSKKLTFFVVSCAGDRNIVSHGYASR